MTYNGQPLTLLMRGRKNRIAFVLVGNATHRTQVYDFLQEVFDSKKNREIIMGIFGFIDQTFPNCSHERKFKKFEGQAFWEIKAKQIRIACFWSGRTLICFYGCRKKDTKWSKKTKTTLFDCSKICKPSKGNTIRR